MDLIIVIILSILTFLTAFAFAISLTNSDKIRTLYGIKITQDSENKFFLKSFRNVSEIIEKTNKALKEEINVERKSTLKLHKIHQEALEETIKILRRYEKRSVAQLTLNRLIAKRVRKLEIELNEKSEQSKETITDGLSSELSSLEELGINAEIVKNEKTDKNKADAKTQNLVNTPINLNQPHSQPVREEKVYCIKNEFGQDILIKKSDIHEPHSKMTKEDLDNLESILDQIEAIDDEENKIIQNNNDQVDQLINNDSEQTFRQLKEQEEANMINKHNNLYGDDAIKAPTVPDNQIPTESSTDALFGKDNPTDGL